MVWEYSKECFNYPELPDKHICGNVLERIMFLYVGFLCQETLPISNEQLELFVKVLKKQSWNCRYTIRAKTLGLLNLCAVIDIYSHLQQAELCALFPEAV